MISTEAIEKLLGISEKTPLAPEEMAKTLKVTFFPHDKSKVSKNIVDFSIQLKSMLEDLGAQIIPYGESLSRSHWSNILKRSLKIFINNFLFLLQKCRVIEKRNHYIPFRLILSLLRNRMRIIPGISVIALGEQETGKLPMDFTSSFSKSSVVHILDMPEGAEKSPEFKFHFDTALSLFAYNMTNVVIGVSSKNWILYNFNASHPIYPRSINFQKNILLSLVPKIAAPLRPVRLREMIVLKESFDPTKSPYDQIARDFINAGKIFESLGVYPSGKKIDDLPFRNSVYRWIGKIHLDNRNGMSYGFMAWQLPQQIPNLVSESFFDHKIKSLIAEDKDYYVDTEGNLNLLLTIDQKRYTLKVPDVWVLSQRSGADKTHLNPQRDLVKLGLKQGKLYLQAPMGLKLDDDYKPSFDTRVMLAHALGNVLIAAVLKHFNRSKDFIFNLEHKGMALVHWHGYLNRKIIPDGWYVHGENNPHVACSTAQSAVYALKGKLDVFNEIVGLDSEYRGDVHLEPQHGTNVTFSTLLNFANYLSSTHDSVSLGNKYLKGYEPDQP